MRLHLLMRYVWLLIPTSHLLHLSSQKCLRIATARAHETSQDLVCRLLLEKKKYTQHSEQHRTITTEPHETKHLLLLKTDKPRKTAYRQRTHTITLLPTNTLSPLV